MKHGATLCWVYRKAKTESFLICLLAPSHYDDTREAMHVLNGAWELNLNEKNGSVTSPHVPEGVEFCGFVWGYCDIADGGISQSLNWEDALDRFEQGERADPTVCRGCCGTGRTVPDELITKT